ncbi:MAG: hypothetical protein PHE49_09585, partial [bacterium]|nr:hypothetical protein [bacterium]
MLLQNWPMQFRGTIKGISPEQAKQMFNYDMPPDAKGVSFSIKNNKTEIRPYFPEKYFNHTPICPLLKTNAKAFSTLSTVAKQILKTIIRPSWTLIADEEKYM